MKVVIIGGVAGGATTATRLRRLDEKAEIIILERGSFVSFANCGLPYYIGDVIKEKQDLLLQTPQSFKERFNIDVRIKSEVLKIDRDNKKVLIKNLITNEEYEESYDKLVLSPGAEPINPFKKVQDDRIYTLRNVDDSVKIKEYIEQKRPENICIIGGGYIGVEIAENIKNYRENAKNQKEEGMVEYNPKVSIIEMARHLIPPLDEDMSGFVHQVLRKNGINVILESSVKDIEKREDSLIVQMEKLKSGEKNQNNLEESKIDSKNVKEEIQEINADLIILCIGVRPESKLAEETGLALNDKKSIIVDKKMKTSDENIYALGDAVQVTNFVTKKPAYIPLAGPANKQARVVANDICGKQGEYEGTVGSSILKIFDYNLAITGINEATCKANEIEYKKMVITPYSHASYYPGATQLTIKALYEPKSGKILGAEVWGKEGVDKIADILATAIRMNLTAHDLSELELCYAPPFSSAKSPVNILGNSIENEMDGLVSNIYVEDLKEKIENREEIYILDVRTDSEYERGHIRDAIHIPLDELRENLEKLDKLVGFDKIKEIYVHCYTGLRSYIACMILKQNGYNVKNIIGGQYFMKVNGIKFEVE